MTMIDCDTFVKSLLASMWMLQDLPRAMRKDLDSQLGVIWLLISDQKCFPTLTFTPEQQEAICRALKTCSDEPDNFKFTYEAMLANSDLKTKVAGIRGAEQEIAEAGTTAAPSEAGACYAGPLDSIEYRIAFESPSEEVWDPIASHLRDVLAICQWSAVPRSAIKPVLHQLDALRQRDEARIRHLSWTVDDAGSQRCKYCEARSSLVLKDYVHICQDCGCENDSDRIQDQVACLPTGQVNCGSVKDAWRLSAEYSRIGKSLEAVERMVRQLCGDHLMTMAQQSRAMYLATLIVLERPCPRAKHDLIVAACAVYVLLETWAHLLVAANVYETEDGRWTTRWVLPTMVFATKTQTKHFM